MAVFLSPGVFPKEIDLSVLPTAVGALTPAFIGTAKKGPLNKPTFISNAQEFIDTFGEPFPESFLGYAALAYFEEGNRAYILRIGVECQEGQPVELSSICIDSSGSREMGWGRIAVFSGIDFGKLCTRVIDADHPLDFHPSSLSAPLFNDIDPTPPTSATLTYLSSAYDGPIDDTFTVIITSDPASGTTMDDAAFQIIRSSDGVIIVSGIINEASPGVSDPIALGNGVIIEIDVTSGPGLGINDTLSFSASPDNSKFAVNVDRTDSSPSVANVYTMPTASYTNPTDFVAAFNLLLVSEEYTAVAIPSQGIACIETNVAGKNIQLTDTEGFVLEIGQSLFAYDIPRSYLQSTDPGTYTITSENNRVSIRVTGQTDTDEINFTLPTGVGIAASSLAASIHLNGVKSGDRFWNSYAMDVPGGIKQVFIETYISHELDELKLLADLSHIRSLRFAEELVIRFPYEKAYRVFNDPRVALPAPGIITSSNPLSCEINPLSSDCLADSSYFEHIVGWIVAKSPGTWVDSLRLSIVTFSQGVGSNPNVAGRFRIIIERNGQAVDAVEDVSFDPRQDRFIANVINEGSRFGGVNGNSFIQWISRPSFLNNDPVNDPANFEVRVPGNLNRHAFVGGANGIPLDPSFSSELDRAIIGNPAAESGIHAFQNPEVFDITLLVIPGNSSGAVIGNGLQLCEARGDCMMLVDPPFGLRPQQVVDWHNGMLFSDLEAAINSSYGALYHPWLKIFDQFSGEHIFIPPSGHVSSVYARTARDTEQWFAPAGLRRGHLNTPIATEVDLTQGERDLMYGFGNAVNPIVNFPQDGITVFGQRTLQRRQSALDRVNVRLLLIFIKKNAVRFLRQFLFEPNDKITRAQVKSVSDSFLADIVARRGLTAFNVVCDERNNTPERIDRNELHVAYFLKPTRAVEFIVLNLVILRTEASFGAAEILAAGGVVTV